MCDHMWTSVKPIKRLVVDVGGHVLFLDSIDGYGKSIPNLNSNNQGYKFPIYMSNGKELWVIGILEYCAQEQTKLCNAMVGDEE